MKRERELIEKQTTTLALVFSMLRSLLLSTEIVRGLWSGRYRPRVYDVSYFTKAVKVTFITPCELLGVGYQERKPGVLYKSLGN